MNQELWTNVDRYFSDLLVPADPILETALTANRAAGLPAIDVSPLQGKLLHLLALTQGARRILEIGTLGGYSSICLARALPVDGRLVTLEAEPKHAEVAQANLSKAGLAHVVEIRIGPALETLQKLADEKTAPFDLIFIDADKSNYPHYLPWALRFSRPGGLIIADNVVRNGQVINAVSEDVNVQGVRRFTELLAAEKRLEATAVQTIGVKGYDGFALARVRA